MTSAILEIARRCHVSPGIVRMVLGACKAEISGQTRETVPAAAGELGYEASPVREARACRLWTRAPN